MDSSMSAEKDEDKYEKDWEENEINEERIEAKYSNLVPILVKAVQELSAKVKELENK